MAKNNPVTIIDFGSLSITVMMATRGTNGTFAVAGKAEIEYSGYLNGEFTNPEELQPLLQHVMEECERDSGYSISDVYIGVPGEFTTVIVKEPQILFDSHRRITDIEIEELFEKGNAYNNHPTHLLINRSPIYYKTDDGRMLIDAKDIKTSKLSGQLSYVLAKRSFTDLITQILLGQGVDQIEFISTCLAESLYLLDSYSRDRFAVLLDIGYTTTNVMLIRGEGLLFLKSFSDGGAFITSDLYECFKVPFHISEELKRKISLTFAVQENDKYDVSSNGSTYTFDAKQAHLVVEARLDEIGEKILKCLKACNIEYPSYINYKLTGGGLSYMRGAREYLGRAINKNIDLAKNPIPQLDVPNMSSTYALMDLALKQRKNKKFIERVFNK